VNLDEINSFKADGSDLSVLSAPQKANGVDVGPRFFEVPGQLFGSGLAQTLGSTTTLLYVALWETADRQRRPGNTFGTTDKNLSSETGLSPRTIRNARNRLIEKDLLRCTQEAGEKLEYTLLPLNLNWTPRDERPRAKKRPRAMRSMVRQSLPEV
jgi:hypothetical protein